MSSLIVEVDLAEALGDVHLETTLELKFWNHVKNKNIVPLPAVDGG